MLSILGKECSSDGNARDTEKEEEKKKGKQVIQDATDTLQEKEKLVGNFPQRFKSDNREMLLV